MAFKPNYNRDRAERDRTARARSAEKLKKKEEKTAQRKALRAAAEARPNGTNDDHKERGWTSAVRNLRSRLRA